MEASTACPAAEAAGAAGAIVAALARAGTRLVFGVPGGGPNLDVVGAAEAAGLRFVLAHGETAATIMAAASADLTGAPGAVVVTRGPGLASAVNGIAHAALDRLPVVVIADTVADTRISHQRIDQEALGRSVAKAAFTVGGPPAAAAAVAARAVGIALAAPAGPVIANTADGAADQHGPPRVENGVEAQTLRAAKDTAARAGRAILAEAVRGARRPVLLLGTGAIPRTATVRDALDGRGIPALHTYRARGVLPDSGAEAAGLVTGGTMEWPLLSAADLIIGLGVDEAEMIPARWGYAARTILVSEPAAPPAHGWFTGATELTMPIDEALDVLAAGPGGTMEWPPDAGRAAKTDGARRLATAATAAPGWLAPQQVVATARACVPPETIATVDAGAHMLVAMPLWEVPGPGRTQIGTRHQPGQPGDSGEGACAVSITVAKFRDVADGIQPGQFMIGDREPVASLADFDPVYKRLLDEPVTAVVAVTGSDGQPNLTPVWFDYDGDTVLLNLATHRRKVDWLRKAPYATFLLMNPENTYHWLSLKTAVRREISEDDPAEGQRSPTSWTGSG
ncbi:MAG TPA: thiamine pyrophosphate-binding protein [Streptosporangiaceae bacterium]|nr:thiamine pyrophosphate-binding protein [Streptosporangiaceae bacterium]